MPPPRCVDMSEPIDLERLETETFRSYQHEDGMWDVFMGLIMAFWALGLLVDSTFVSLLMLVPPAVFIAGKAIITVPRLGRVMFNRRRVGRELILVVAVVAAVVTTSIVVLVVARGFEGLDRAGDALFIVMAIVIFTIIAYMLKVLAYRRMGRAALRLMDRGDLHRPECRRCRVRRLGRCRGRGGARLPEDVHSQVPPHPRGGMRCPSTGWSAKRHLPCPASTGSSTSPRAS